jgi:hypothetical protein
MSDFNKDSTVYITRISPTRKEPIKDYNKMKKQIEGKKEAIWDKDTHNRLKKDNYIGFILGDKNKEYLEVFKIIEERSCEERNDTEWKDGPYTPNNGESSNTHREIIVLSRDFSIFSWDWWKSAGSEKKYAVNCESWMPRGTQKSRNPLN